ncbi:MAG: pantoate--beta-alanine ligase [Gammaproteobacteria bacterium]|jgi:pantoate--beta-alanine ligase
MKLVDSIAALRAQVTQWKAKGLRVALVPTMGNLHRGHLALVAEACERADKVVATIFVNPTQFGEGEDFDGYPRTLAADAERLESTGCDLLFVPTTAEMYPFGQQDLTRVQVPQITNDHCGASRPGHFDGVSTVVNILFNLVQPDVACFGTKDYQQLAVLKRMARDLCIPVEIVGVPTVRENDGLAKSSRNQYLTESERQIAPRMYQILQAVQQELTENRERSGYTFRVVEAQALQKLADAGFEPEYLTICYRDDLEPAKDTERLLVVLIAARLGKARLIDNLEITL